MPTLLLNALASGVAFALSFFCLISLNPPNQQAIRWFGGFVLSVGFALLGHAAWQGGYGQAYPYLVPVCELTRFALAPALYLSIWHFTHPQPMRVIDLRWHFAAALLFLGTLLPFFLTAGGLTRWLPPDLSRAAGLLTRYGIKGQVLAYWVGSLRLVSRHQHHVRLLAASVHRIQLTWLYGLLAAIAVMIGLWLAEPLLTPGLLDACAGWGYAGSLFAMAYFLIRQPEVFAFSPTDKQALQVLLAEQDGQAELARPARLTPRRLGQLKEQLDQLLTQDKVFMEADLNLAGLARRLSMSINDLSFLINEGYGVNFFTLINRHRVEEAKRLLGSPDHQHLSVLGIAYEVGFSAKTTFNGAFKKQVGETPSAYLKRIKRSQGVPMYPSERPA